MNQQTLTAGTELKAYQVMSHPLFTASIHDSIRDVAELFLEYGISGAPVMDDDERAVGVITKTDLARFERDKGVTGSERSGISVAAEPVEAGEDGEDVPAEERVSRWMMPTIYAVSSDAGLADVSREMLRNGVHHIFVRDDASERLLGVITSFDLLKVLTDLLHGRSLG